MGRIKKTRRVKKRVPKAVKRRVGLLKYERMIEGMQRNQKKSIKKRADPWFVYMLRCENETLYTGIAKDIERRFKAHQTGKGARYTRMHPPLEIVYRETCKTRTDALVREFNVKKLTPKRKRDLAEAYRAGGKKLKKAIRASLITKRKKKVGTL